MGVQSNTIVYEYIDEQYGYSYLSWTSSWNVIFALIEFW